MIYIDCGFWQGRALEIYRDIGLVDKTWKIYVFEPNPEIDVDGYVKGLGLPAIISREAVWINDEPLTFCISNRENASGLEGLAGQTDPKKVIVQGMDFSKFVAELPDEFTVCNMDTEGSEFQVVEKLIEDGTIDKINIMEIEFHHRLMKDYEPKDAEKLIEEMVRHNVKVIIKVPLN